MNGESLKDVVESVKSKTRDVSESLINRIDQIPSRSEVIDEIKFSGLENEDVLKKVSDYSLEKKALFEKKNPKTAEIELALHMADIYFEAGLVDIAMTNIASAREQAEDISDEEMIQKVEEIEKLVVATYRA